MAKTQLKKDQVQAKVLELINQNSGHGIVEGATGVGKTKIAIDYIVSNNITDVLWVVPTTLLRDITVPDEWSKWGHSKYFDKHVKIICYRSLHKEDSFYKQIILDEGHNITEKAYNCETLVYKKYNRILMLTATTPREVEKRQILAALNLKVIAAVRVDAAVNMGIVAPFEIHCYPVTMSTKNDFTVNTKAKSYVTSESYRYSSLQRQISRYPKGKAPKPLYLARMHSIYRFKSKIRAAEKILSRIPAHTRTLIFCGSIEVAEELCEFTYHSKTDSTDYERFNRKEINRLAVVNALNEGHNMVDVDAAIMVQVNSKKRNYIQRQGRAIRWRKGHKAIICILYSDGTVDANWVRSSLDGIDKKKINYHKAISV